MKQVIQNLRTGETILEEVPVPILQSGHLLIKSHCSLVSIGTERMIVEFSKANIIHKARLQPERVSDVLDKIKSEGIIPTLEAVFRKLDEPIPLGYCNAGEVVEVAADVHEFKVGDRVASNGNHAEYVLVTKNLCAKIPDSVSYQEACFTTIGAIALQGIRNVQPQSGDTVLVIGLGLIGMITCFLLKLNGCNVVACEISEEKIALAEKNSIKVFHSNNEALISDYIRKNSKMDGADSVIITASASGNEIISMASRLCRKKGKIVLVGVVGLDINRNEFYKKEISFIVSSSYGPGRYDSHYEEKGIDYPPAFVRWTAKRNFEAILKFIEDKMLEVSPLISSKTPLQEVVHIYNHIRQSTDIAAIIFYPPFALIKRQISLQFDTRNQPQVAVVGIIGAGNFTRATLLPTLKKCKANIKFICSAQGLHATLLAKKFHIPQVVSDAQLVLDDEETDSVIIATRHHTHAQLVIKAMKANKNIFVEKPLAIKESELREIKDVYDDLKFSKILHIGFNRRYAPFTKILCKHTKNATDLNIQITVNAGSIPIDNWVQDIEIGGGRIIGEACHFIDLAAYISNSIIKSVYAQFLGNDFRENVDNVQIQLKMQNGANATVQYISNGSKRFPKERIEVFFEGKTICIENFKRIKGYHVEEQIRLFPKKDKGHLIQMKTFLNSVKSGKNDCIPFHEIINTTQATFAVMQSLKENKVVYLQHEDI